MQDLNELKEIERLHSLSKRKFVVLLCFLIGSITAAMIFIAITVRNNLINDSAVKTQALSAAIKSSLRILMLKRDPNAIQETLEQIEKNKDSIVKVFILDKTGGIAYSTDKADIGKVLNRFSEESCHACHQKIDKAPAQNTIVIKDKGIKVHRNINVIYNEEACYGCHSRSDRINGKLLIDRSLKQTDALIFTIELIIFGSGAVCLALIIPFLLVWINKYVTTIIMSNRENILLFAIAKRLSKTIDIKELRHIVIDVMIDAFDADEVVIIHPKNIREYRSYAWERSKNEITRRKVDKNDFLQPFINDWFEGRLSKEIISDDGKQVYMPVAKGDINLALICIRVNEEPFGSEKLKLISAVCNYMCMAFENARLYNIAISDELTHLYTQRYFRNCIDREFLHFERYGHKITLLMIDIDDFKKINDTHGHLIGDSVLSEIAACILQAIRDSDLAFRYGGEEFAVILPSTDDGGGMSVAERIRAAIEKFVFVKGTHNLKITVSIGVSTCPNNATTIKELILTADNALYLAKERGKNRFVVSGKE